MLAVKKVRIRDAGKQAVVVAVLVVDGGRDETKGTVVLGKPSNTNSEVHNTW